MLHNASGREPEDVKVLRPIERVRTVVDVHVERALREVATQHLLLHL